jgi:hypothetical protein
LARFSGTICAVKRGVTQLGVQRLDRQLGAILVENPSPTLIKMIAKMIAALVRSPTANDVSAAATSKISSGLRS